jgi:SpoVK/Ycf46/Vps4 family AAA+-type ATPase
MNQSEALKEATETIKELQGTLERLSEAGLSMTSIVAVEGKFAITAKDGGFTYATNVAGCKAGDTVLVHPMTGQIVQKIQALMLGDIHTISAVKKGIVKLHLQNETRIISPGKFEDLKQGDKVLLDPSHKVVLHIVEQAKLGKPPSIKKITWDDVGGHTEAKQLLREAIELPYKHPNVFQHYGKRAPKGMMFYGPPGCGKTLLGKATASAIDAEGAFISIKGPEILNEYVGVSERAVRDMFQRARDHKSTTGKPAVIFIDEADALLTVRGNHGNYMGQTIVPAFLTEMDGLEDSSAMVILSTNRADTLDPAVIREGRIDHKIEIKRPSFSEAKDIFSIHLNGAPIVKGVDRDGLVTYAAERLYEPVNGRALPHSGALIAGCVDKATTAAIRRDLATGRPSGLCKADFTWATDQIKQQEVFA